MTIIPCNKVIDMANYPKDEGISFFEEIFEFTEIRQVKRKSWEGQFLKRRHSALGAPI